MSDIEELLDRTARSAGATPSPDIVEGDVRRGRTALLRRRRRRAVGTSIASTVAAAGLVAAAIVVGSPDGSSEAPTVLPDRSTSPDAGGGVRLVTYAGEQPEGFIVDMVPEGWYIQQNPDHPQYSLAIAQNGDTSHPDSFSGKLVVMLLSSSAPQELPPGEPVQVGDHEGTVNRNGGHPGGASLTYEDGEGHFVQVQAPPALAWSDEQLASFAEGVTVTSDALAGVG
jgi:hypothetical protein